jgi:hypothetical protein
MASSGTALIIDGAGNASAPASDPGWSYVGALNGASCVYLGNGWVLTAGHVGEGTVNLNGTAYQPDLSIQPVSFPTSSDSTTSADLEMFRLKATPAGLGTLSMIDPNQALSTATQVTAISYGMAAATANPTWWNSSWQEQMGTPAYSGYDWGSGGIKRWGTNYLSGSGLVDDGHGVTSSLKTQFNSIGDANEFQAASGDSGGAVFTQINGTWELAGVILAIDMYDGQPAGTAVYGNDTYCADLRDYASQIQAEMDAVPEPGTSVLFGIGAISLLAYAWRRRTPA